MAGGIDASDSARRLMMRLELFGQHGEPRFSFHDPNGEDIFDDFHGMEDDDEDDEEEEEEIPNVFEANLSMGSSMNHYDVSRLDRHVVDALHAAGVPDAAFALGDIDLVRRGDSGLQINDTSLRRSPRLQWRRHGGVDSERVPLLSLAQENVGDFDPCWARNNNTTSSTSSNASSGRPQPTARFYDSIYEEGPNHVHLLAKGERVVRAASHVPITTKVYGFRFAVDSLITTSGNGSNRFIIGLAPSPTSFHISDGAICLGPFWGIDDKGHVIESRLDFIQSIISRGDHNIALTSSSGNTLIGHRTSSSNSTALIRGNVANILSDQSSSLRSIDTQRSTSDDGDNENSVTIIIDNSSRLITFMKGELIIGSTTKPFPAASSLYPVALSYDVGSIIAITSVKNDPVVMIREFKVKILLKKQQRLLEREQETSIRRSKLIHFGQPTPELEEALRSIFSWYVQDENSPRVSDVESLGPLSAARLWYRCGLRLSLLYDILELDRTKEADSDNMYRITFLDFFKAICSVIATDNCINNRESFEVRCCILSSRLRFEQK